MTYPTIKITLNGKGGELDSRQVALADSIKEALLDMIKQCEIEPGDSITIEEVE